MIEDLVSEIALDLGLGPSAILRIIRNAPDSYKTFKIPKKSSGFRVISQPPRELKIVQRSISQILLQALPCHRAATAYRPGSSIRANATPHAGHSPIAKFDFKDFFPNITASDWAIYCGKNEILSERDITLSKRALFMRPSGGHILRLAVGAPSSPTVSNAIMFDFDTLVCERLLEERIVYTRYADDITLSAPRTGFLNAAEKIIRRTIRDVEYPCLSLNREKTHFVTTSYGRRVTGLILSNDGRVTIGRDKKRWIRAAIDHLQKNRISQTDFDKLTGWIAFAKGVEPEYYLQLRSSYGGEVISRILKNRPARKGIIRRKF